MHISRRTALIRAGGGSYPTVTTSHRRAHLPGGPTRPRSTLKDDFAPRRRQDPQHLAVLRHGAPGDLDALLLGQTLDDGLITERVQLLFLVDHLFDRLLDALTRDVLIRYPSGARVEEVLEFKEALRAVQILPRGDA